MRTDTTTPGPASAALSSRRLTTLAIVCGVILSTGTNNDGTVAAFAPSHHRAPSAPIANTCASGPTTNVKIATSSGFRTRLAYKHVDGGSEEYDANTNETAVSSNNNEDIFNEADQIVAEIHKKDVIFYNDLDDTTIIDESGSDEDDLTVIRLGDNVEKTDKGGESLIHELEAAIQKKNIHLEDDDTEDSDQTKTSVPSKANTKRHLTPVQMIKKVPKVEPIHMSTVFFLKLIGDPMWPSTAPSASPTPEPKASEPKKKPAVENWKTRMQQRKKKSTAFMASNYLESLSANNASGNPGAKGNDDTIHRENEKANDLMKALRDQQAQIRAEKLKAQKEAIYEATRRTNPGDVVAERIEKGEKERKRKEREQLERLYVERKERLDAKKMDEEAEARELLEKLEERARERGEAVAAQKKTLQRLAKRPGGKRGIPILDRPFVDAAPLLVGSALTLSYGGLTPFQQRVIEVAREFHEEHIEKMKLQNEEGTNESSEDVEDGASAQEAPGDEGGIEAAPIIAVIDGYTAAATEEAFTPHEQLKEPRRYATLASVEFVGDNGNGEPVDVKITGVGRVFLRGYFSSKDAGMTREEEELSNILAKIAEIDREEELWEEEEEDVELAGALEEDGEEEEEDDEVAVVLGQFDLLLDDSSVLSNDESTKYGGEVTKSRASSMHAITELYRCANKVFRLHEERKKLVAGLRAAEMRVRLGQKASAEECFVEFEDCDGLGLISGMIDEPMVDVEEEPKTVPQPLPISEEIETAPIRSRLETLENYGLGSYGILSTIPDLTEQLMTKLEPYYSPEHREREEYEAEVASFVVLKSLEAYASTEEVAKALVVPSSATQRLELAYEMMMQHRDELIELVEMISRELMDCGEECTDLW